VRTITNTFTSICADLHLDPLQLWQGTMDGVPDGMTHYTIFLQYSYSSGAVATANLMGIGSQGVQNFLGKCKAFESTAVFKHKDSPAASHIHTRTHARSR
jgi:hypothetical protein